MKFIDEAEISVSSGNGGKGCVSFRREKFVPRGGPDGGDGGRGGDVIIVSTTRKRTLYHFQFQRQFKAKNGANGQGSQKTGKSGADLTIEVPPGTIIYNAETGEIIRDCDHPDESFIVAKGGKGGQGNKGFATSTHRAPKFAQPGEPGQTFKLRLELKLLADVGIIGFPNVGKSRLIHSISSAKPKIADYPFTTLTPNLGVVRPPRQAEPFVVADIPGLIEGAHKGHGLGLQFLRHIERTRVLIHLIDASEIKPEDPLYTYRAVNHELALFKDSLALKPQLIVINKMDLPESAERAELFKSALPETDILLISAMTGKGLDDLVLKVGYLLHETCSTPKKSV